MMGEVMLTMKAEATRPGDVIETARRVIAGLLASLQATGDKGANRGAARGHLLSADLLREVIAQDLRDLSLRQAPLCRRKRRAPDARRLH